MKKNILLFLIAACSITTSAFTKLAELKIENDDLSAVIKYYTEDTGKFLSRDKIPAEITVTNKSVKEISFKPDNLFKDLKVKAYDPRPEYEAYAKPFSKTIQLGTTAGITVFIAFMKWTLENLQDPKAVFTNSQNYKFWNLQNWKDAKMPTIATALAGITVIGAYLYNKYCGQPEYLEYCKNMDTNCYIPSKGINDKIRLDVHASKKALEKQRSKRFKLD